MKRVGILVMVGIVVIATYVVPFKAQAGSSRGADSSVTAGKSKTSIKRTSMLDVMSYGYKVNVFINGIGVYSGKDTSYSGIMPKGIKKGLNRLKIKYQQIPNSVFKKLEIKVRLVGKNKKKTLFNWQAPNNSGTVNLSFTF